MPVTLVIRRQWYFDANRLGSTLEPAGLSSISLSADITVPWHLTQPWSLDKADSHSVCSGFFSLAGFVLCFSKATEVQSQGLTACVPNLRFPSGKNKSCMRGYCTALQFLLAAAARAVAILFQFKNGYGREQRH